MKLTESKAKPSKTCLLCNFISIDINHAAQRARRFISREHIQYVAKEAYKIPDSDSCQKALAMVAQFSPDYLLNHCLRSYAFGVAMAHKVKQPFDKEVFFLGTIMHDLGLTPEFDAGNTFEVDGAKAARAFCIKHNVKAEKADLVHEMVVHHNSVGFAHKMDPEIALLHFGAGADVAGIMVKDIHTTTLAEVLSEYPRLDFKEGMAKLLTSQINNKPNSYMAPFLQLGFLNKINKLPF